MSVFEKIGELIAHAHAHGYASQLPESVQEPLKHLAEEIDQLKTGGAATIDPRVFKAVVDGKVKEIVEPFLTELRAMFTDRVAELESSISALQVIAQVAGKSAAEPPAAEQPEAGQGSTGVGVPVKPEGEATAS